MVRSPMFSDERSAAMADLPGSFATHQATSTFNQATDAFYCDDLNWQGDLGSRVRPPVRLRSPIFHPHYPSASPIHPS